MITNKDNKIVIKVERLSKRYLIGGKQRQWTIRDSVDDFIHHPFGIGAEKHDKQEFWALDDVSFEIKKGDVVGIIGRNGSGKSTLLKILARIVEPTKGKVTMRGRVASLLEVGTGFNPELTGRENIYLNGAILGMSQKEIAAKFDEIVAFSGVEQFIDTPVKRYSSGMYVRLAFAVAAHLDSDILLVDEVLAVGDAEFQKKCLGKMDSLAKSGKTVLFVSHDSTAINKLCKKTMLLSEGKIRSFGSTSVILSEYLSQSNAIVSDKYDLSNIKRRFGIEKFQYTGIQLFDSKENSVPYLTTGQTGVIRLFYRNDGKDIHDCRASIGISNSQMNLLILFSSDLTSTTPMMITKKDGYIDCTIDRLPLSAGTYLLNLFFEGNGSILDSIDNEVAITVNNGRFYTGDKNCPVGWSGKTVLVNHAWNIH